MGGVQFKVNPKQRKALEKELASLREAHGEELPQLVAQIARRDALQARADRRPQTAAG